MSQKRTRKDSTIAMCYVLQRRAGLRLSSPRFGIWGCCTLAISKFSQCIREVSAALCTATQQMPAEQPDQTATGQINFCEVQLYGKGSHYNKSCYKSCLWTNKRHQFAYISEDVLHRVFCYLSFIRSVWSCTKRECWDCEGLKYLHLLTWTIMCRLPIV